MAELPLDPHKTALVLIDLQNAVVRHEYRTSSRRTGR
jgi:hypothetical protein